MGRIAFQSDIAGRRFFDFSSSQAFMLNNSDFLDGQLHWTPPTPISASIQGKSKQSNKRLRRSK